MRKYERVKVFGTYWAGWTAEPEGRTRTEPPFSVEGIKSLSVCYVLAGTDR